MNKIVKSIKEILAQTQVSSLLSCTDEPLRGSHAKIKWSFLYSIAYRKSTDTVGLRREEYVNADDTSIQQNLYICSN